MSKILQIFNVYQQYGSEEEMVNRLSNFLGSEWVENCFFYSKDWNHPVTPAPFEKFLLPTYNPTSIRKLREAQQKAQAKVWLTHNVIPVGSMGVFKEALDQGIPVINYIHNFRPYSVNSSLLIDGVIDRSGLEKNFIPEILRAPWRGSRLQSLALAMAFSVYHAGGWERSIQGWMAESNFVKQIFVEAGVPEEKIHVFFPFREPPQNRPPIEDRGFYLYVGRLIPEKGVRVMVEAWNLLKQNEGSNAPRLIVCGAGPLTQEMMDAAKENSLIEFRGRVSDVEKNELYRTCSAVLVPSIWWEILGFVTFEAYEWEKPVLAGKSGGLTETVEHGVTGFHHEPGNSQQLANQVMTLASDSQMRMSFGRAGYEWNLRETSPLLWRERFENMVCQIIGS